MLVGIDTKGDNLLKVLIDSGDVSNVVCYVFFLFSPYYTHRYVGLSSFFSPPSSPCQELDGSGLLGVSKTVMLWRQWFSDTMVRGSEESAKLKLDRRWEESWDCQEIDEYKTEVKYSYYAILILDTIQLIVNSPQCMGSYRKSRKLTEGTTSLYVILEWSRVWVIAEVRGSSWNILEGSG